MAATRSKFTFESGMFEEALAADAWQAVTTDRARQVEASEQLSELARNIGSYPGSYPTSDFTPRFSEPSPLDLSFIGTALAEEAGVDTPFTDVHAAAGEPAPGEPEHQSFTEPASAAPPAARPTRAAALWKLANPGEIFTVFRQDCPTSYLEQFQLLRTQLLLMRAQCAADDELRCVCLTSARKGEGKTFTARNLAATLSSASGKKVLLIETGRREASLPESVLGLEAALAEPELWRDSVAELATSSLSILAGLSTGQAADFEPLPALLAAVKPHFDWVIIDAPAIHDAAAAEWVVAAADAALLVVRQGDTTFDSLGDASSRIPRGRLAGVVMNKIPQARRSSWWPRLPKVRIRWTRRAA